MECAEKCRNDAHRLPEARDGERPYAPQQNIEKEQGGYGRNGKAAAGTDGKSHLKHEGLRPGQKRVNHGGNRRLRVFPLREAYFLPELSFIIT